MPRPLSLLLCLLAAFAYGATPVLAKATVSVPPIAHTAGDDSGDDQGDVCDESDDCSGDDCATDNCAEDPDPGDDSCTQQWDDDSQQWIDVDGSCDDSNFCDDASAGDDGSDDDALAADTAADDCAGDEADAEVAPPRVSKLHATVAQVRHGRVVLVAFKLDQDGKVTLALTQVGARSSARCAATPAKARHRAHAKRRAACPRAVAPSGTLSFSGHAGANQTTLRRWKGRALAPGSYRLTVTPLADGAQSATATFKLRAAR